MAVLLGVDEAGYGPLLGPLCVAATAFRAESAPDREADPAPHPASPPPLPRDPLDLWSRLDSALCRKPRDRRGRIAIADSKKLKRPNGSCGHALEHLERGVLVFLTCANQSPPQPLDDLALLKCLGAPPPPTPPWDGAPFPLPLANDPALLSIASTRLAQALHRARVQVLFLRVRALDAPSFNAALHRTRSKAAVNTGVALEHLLDAATRYPRQDLIATLDRHGGRIHYREELAFTFPGARLRVLEESDACSRYELHDGGRRIEVSWEVDAESRRLPVALASMAAKLTRELWMARLNRYFAHFLPELKPTAGYVQDGRRWLADVAPHWARVGVCREHLVRLA